jgi:hypothetical protein
VSPRPSTPLTVDVGAPVGRDAGRAPRAEGRGGPLAGGPRPPTRGSRFGR